MNKEFDITVIGSVRAGKTSLLSTIYSQFSEVIELDNDLEIRPARDLDDSLGNYVQDLQNAFGTTTQMPLNNADVVQPTVISKTKDNHTLNGRSSSTTDYTYKLNGLNSSDIEYRFNLGQKNKKPKIQLVLRDYPGEQLADHPKDVIRRIRDCAVTMIAIDTPALMIEESKRQPWRFHKDRNLFENGKPGPNNLCSIFEEAYKEINGKKLVVLAPVKCEKWMADPACADQLLERIKLGYKPLLDLLASMKDNVAVVVTPVETLGNIIYAYMDQPNAYSPQFMKETILAKYNPRYGDQPLRYILRFVIKRFLENPGFWFHWFGNDKPFVSAMDNFARGCKADPLRGNMASGFTVIQGSQLL
ncbi:hypothetical protein GCM10028806_29540 [Spirosoma terrae]|uniref:Uncharacterized protein n=1 Tax=Spirosoma terrae TaxID=1968276 RepID=A0A6L9LQ40_9BACT|nr:hypothetical protein [Spirosoma terrae]NDU99079.1 hypothetical protein [Spirosoma terrae]